MAQTFTCPSCGAGLEYDGDDDPVVRCNYCGQAIIVPESLRAPQPAAWTAQPASSVPLTIDLKEVMGLATHLRQVKQLVREGRIDEATALYQSATGARAEEATEVVQRLATGQSVVISGTGTGASLPVVTGRQGVTGAQATQILAEQLGNLQQRGQQVGRALIWIIVGAVVLFCAVALMVFLLIQRGS